MLAKKHPQTNFMSTWFITTIRKSKDRFYQNFAMGLKVHPLLYKGVNLGISIRNTKRNKGNYNGTNESKMACCNKTTTNCLRVAKFKGS
jgi:hypothetical protein